MTSLDAAGGRVDHYIWRRGMNIRSGACWHQDAREPLGRPPRARADGRARYGPPPCPPTKSTPPTSGKGGLDRGGRLLAHRGYPVRVSIQGHRDRTVAQKFLYELGVDVCAQEQGCRRVPEIVKTHVR